jgi:Tfp pilus assembly protein PilX
MKNKTNLNVQTSDRKSERGAALLTVLLVSILLLSAGLALVTSTTLSTTTTIDATAEMQAYAGAEAGLEAALNVMRGNIAPDSSLTGTKMNFRNAANPPTANKTSDPWRTGTAAQSRLSGWLNYSYQNPSDANDWRVPVTSSYAPLTGIAYKVTITDPDDPGPIATRKITTNPGYRPSRLLIKSEGYGPKGAVKRLEMIARYSAFDLVTPGAITLAGGATATLSLGSSNANCYSGADHASSPQSGVAAVAISSGNLAIAQMAINSINGDPGSTAPSPCSSGAQVAPCAALALIDSNTPSFLQSADAARAFLAERRKEASDTNRLFPTKAAAITAGGLGTTIVPKFTFIDNYGTSTTPGPTVDLGSNHQGSGLLIVTGNLDTNGNTDFEGVILVLGRGNITRSGGGNGTIKGTIIVANFDPNGAPGDPFGAPAFSISGGGNSCIQYDSSWVEQALAATGVHIMGVREYH